MTATAADGNKADDAYVTVTADGADAAFCQPIKRTCSRKDDYTPPVVSGGEGSLTYRGYRRALTMQQGECGG